MFLANPALSGFVTGTTIQVDGGLLNQTSKVAETHRNTAAVRHGAGSWGRQRFEVDANRAPIALLFGHDKPLALAGGVDAAGELGDAIRVARITEEPGTVGADAGRFEPDRQRVPDDQISVNHVPRRLSLTRHIEQRLPS